MDTKQVKTFLELSRLRSYQEASQSLSYAPSTLYAHIQALENELGVPLFDKAGKKLCLTREGEEFLPYAKRFLREYKEALEAVSSKAPAHGIIGLGGCEVNTALDIVPAISGFARRYPDIRLSLVSVSNASIPDLVRSGNIELGFYFTLTQQPLPGLEMVPLYQEPVCLFGAKGHPLAGKEGLRYTDLSGASFAFPHDDCLFVVEMLERFSRAGVEIGRASYLGGVQLVLDQVRSGQSLAIMPLSAVKKVQERMDVSLLGLQESPLWVWETLLYKDFSTLSVAARSFLLSCRSYARALGNASPEQIRLPAASDS